MTSNSYQNTPSPFTLRSYQRDAVQATITHFKQSDDPAVIVLPTGAGKSLVIAQLAALAKRKVLVLAHVKELVEQNHAKYEGYGLIGGIYSAGLKQKQTAQQVTFASVQSVSANLDDFVAEYSLVVVDECHRVSQNEQSQYGRILAQLKAQNPSLKVLGLTATPYRLDEGWIYQTHYRGMVRSLEPKIFKRCIYELPLRYLIKSGFLTEPNLVDATIAQYDFSALATTRFGEFNTNEVNALLVNHKRVTRSIIEQVEQLAQQRKGVMVFAATVEHAIEVASYLPAEQTALITGDTPTSERDTLISQFKAQQIKFLVNVSVLTTGFDAPHVDLIAILRPTQSISLFQQMVGRGLRLAPEKTDCLIIDYAGNGFDLYAPEVGEPKPDSTSVPVQVFCPVCDFPNVFWGKVDGDGDIIEHYGRRCWGIIEPDSPNEQVCDYRFRFKECPHCAEPNDIAARRCQSCGEAIIDPDDQLKSALKLKDAKVLRCSGVSVEIEGEKLTLIYHDEDGATLTERFDFNNDKQKQVFNRQFGARMGGGSQPVQFKSISDVDMLKHTLPHPDFVIARQSKRYWRIQEKIFDYQGRYRKANQLN